MRYGGGRGVEKGRGRRVGDGYRRGGVLPLDRRTVHEYHHTLSQGLKQAKQIKINLKSYYFISKGDTPVFFKISIFNK